MLKGIDVSRWQGLINWAVVKQNVDFAMIKIGGSDDGFYTDSKAVRNVIGARDNNMLRGFYVFLGGVGTIQEEVAHIKNLISEIGGLQKGEILALDWERKHPDEVGYMTGIVEGLARLGYESPMIYMSLSYVRRSNWSNLVTRNCPLWVAAWGNNDDIPDNSPVADEWGRWTMWQYSSVGKVPGIDTRVDMNYFAGDSLGFKAVANKYPVSASQPVAIPAIAFPNNPLATEYIVQPGDSLSRIASRFGKSWQELWAMNRDRVADPNKIYPNQQLRVWNTAGHDVTLANQPVAAPAVPPSLIPENPQLPTATHQPLVHVVVNGENLSVIAARYGLLSWVPLYNANRQSIGANPNVIRPGLVLTIP